MRNALALIPVIIVVRTDLSCLFTEHKNNYLQSLGIMSCITTSGMHVCCINICTYQ